MADLHATLIALHATTATISLITGIIVVTHHRLFDLYLTTLVAAVAALVGAVGVAWQGRDLATNLLFAGLVVLGAALVRSAVLARADRPARGRQAPQRFLDRVGFTLISLFEGFVIVAVLTRGGPGWLALAVAVGGVVVGRAALHRVGTGGSPTPA